MATRIKDTDRGMRDLIRKLNLSRADVVVGIHGTEAHADHKEAGIPLVELATIHEFGGPMRITAAGPVQMPPKRSFIRASFDLHRARNKKLLAREAVAILTKGRSLRVSLSRVGEVASGQVRELIADGIEPENAESTILRKGSSKPLIDSGQLRNSVTYEVRGG